MLTQEQIIARRKCITGTDIASILGLSKWASPLSVYCEKLGLSEPIEDNRYMEWGRRLEPIIAQKYAEETRCELEQGSFLNKGLFGGTPDFIATLDGEKHLVEIKTTSSYSAKDWGEPGSDQIPEYYMTQVQWYLNLLDFKHADVVCLIGGNDYRVYPISRNDKLISIMTFMAEKFWNDHILKLVPPMAEKPIDDKVLDDMFKYHNDAILDRPILDETARKLHDLANESTRIGNEIDKLRSEIKQTIGENAGVKGSFWQATWKKISDSRKTDWQAIANELKASDELIRKHTRKVDGYRRFNFRSQL